MREGDPETYLLPLTFAGGDRAAEILQSSPEAVIAQLKTRRAGAATDGVLFDARVRSHVSRRAARCDRAPAQLSRRNRRKS